MAYPSQIRYLVAVAEMARFVSFADVCDRDRRAPRVSVSQERSRERVGSAFGHSVPNV
jgi:hypothetical protein